MCRRYSLLLIAGLVVPLLWGCRPRTLFYEFQPVTTEGWCCTDTLRFAPLSVPEEGGYSLNLVVRFGNRFQYRDLWMVVEQRLQEVGAKHRMHYLPHRDTVHLVLANEEGKWLTPGVVAHEEDAFVGQLHLLETETLEVLVYHIMSEQELQGLTEVGIRLDPSTSKVVQ